MSQFGRLIIKGISLYRRAGRDWFGATRLGPINIGPFAFMEVWCDNRRAPCLVESSCPLELLGHIRVLPTAMQPHPLCLNYRYDLPGRRLLEAIKATAKSSLSMVGTTLEASAAIVTFLADSTTISFHLASGNHLSVRAPGRRASEALRICRQLCGRQFIQPLHEKLSGPNKDPKPFRPAHEILAEHMAKAEWQEHIVVLPEAWTEAQACPFEHDGTLDRTLKGLLAYAKLKADPANALKPDEYLAEQAGLGHFGADLGLQAKTKYAADYSATYQGVVRLFPLHVTLGKGLKPQSCMSIYMDWDPVAQKLLLARFGRHGRGA